MTRYFIDTEFIEDGKTIDLVSIGIVCEDGREYYAQSVEFDPAKANGWVREHVLSQLPDCPWRTRGQMIYEIMTFMAPEIYGKPELYGYYSAYDYIAFCQLFGTMMDLPEGYPMLIYDLRQWLDMNDLQDVCQPDDSSHNALSDARWVAETYKRYEARHR